METKPSRYQSSIQSDTSIPLFLGDIQRAESKSDETTAKRSRNRKAIRLMATHHTNVNNDDLR